MSKRKVRRYGSGAVQQLPSGSWRARLRAAGQTVGRTFATREKAEEWLRQSSPGVAVANVFGLPDRGERPDCTFAEAAELLPAAWAARGRTADSIRGYRSHLTAAMKDWGPRRIADTRPAAVSRLDRRRAECRPGQPNDPATAGAVVTVR